jgi:hypothetical protein
MYGLLMKTVAGAVIDLVRSEKRIGATPGILMILHTWTRQMTYHPHVHLLITAGGVSDDGRHWLAGPDKFLLPVRALSKIIGARFRDAAARRTSSAITHVDNNPAARSRFVPIHDAISLTLLATSVT